MTKFIATFYCRNLFTPLETPSHHPYTTTCSLAGSRRGRIISLNILYVAYFPFRCSRKTCDRAYGQRMDNEGTKSSRPLLLLPSQGTVHCRCTRAQWCNQAHCNWPLVLPTFWLGLELQQQQQQKHQQQQRTVTAEKLPKGLRFSATVRKLIPHTCTTIPSKREGY